MRFWNLITALMVLIAIIGASTPSLAESETFSSFFTPLEQCKVITREKMEMHYFKEKCPGKEGYNVYVEGGDDRSWLVLTKGALEIKRFEPPIYFENISGKVLEWRYRTVGGKKTLMALIYRVTVNRPDEPDKFRSFLYVIRLEPKKSCVLGDVSSNDEAHKLADSDQQCP